jgi:extracellular matrix regulatory protein B
MYLSIGNDMAVREKSIIGIFDLDNTSTSNRTREFLEKCEKEGEVIPCDDLPKSFILTDEYRMNRIYLSSLSAQTLLSRIQGYYNKNE